MKTNKAIRHRSELLREFFACAVVIAAIKSGDPVKLDSSKQVTETAAALL